MSFFTYIGIVLILSVAIRFVHKLYKYIENKLGFIMVALVLFGLNLGLALFSLEILHQLIDGDRSIVFILFVAALMILQFIGTIHKVVNLAVFLRAPADAFESDANKIKKQDLWARA